MTVFLCVGTNKGELVPTWFYALRSHVHALAFVNAAQQEFPDVTWDVPLPCEVDTSIAALQALRFAHTN